ncbi:MAG: hypothetical protein JXB26_11385 [Candidatus Aminicenantes bacterium]|nr:hypothetical protein [Candidatus Aminicenantes bacterium]
MKKSIFILLFLLFFISCIKNRIEKKAGAVLYPHYDIEVKINPEDGYLDVKGRMTCPVRTENINKFAFYLHKNLEMASFAVNGNGSLSLDTSESDIRYMVDALKYSIVLPKDTNEQPDLKINFSYSGHITSWPSWSPNVIGTDWIEIGSYFPWYPYHPDRIPFTYTCKVEINPAYNVFVMGHRKTSVKKILFETVIPTNSIVVCASKDLKIEERKLQKNAIRIAYTSLSKKNVDMILQDLEKIFGFYSGWYGEKNQDISLVESKREKGGGYVRIGGLFLAELSGNSYMENRAGYQRYLGHELAHFWWYKADTSSWED